MRVAWIVLGLLAVTAARSMKKRSDEEENHWVSGFLAGTDNDFDDAKKASIIEKILSDMRYFQSVVEKTLNGENADHGKYEVLGMLSGALQLVKMHEEKAEAGHSLIPVTQVSIPAGCTKDDVIALKECSLMVNRVLNCIKGGSQGVINKLASTIASFEEKVGVLKAMILKITEELDNIRMLFEHCTKPVLPKHWEQAWKLTEADISNPDEAEKKLGEFGYRIYEDVKAIRDNLNILLSGKGGEKEFSEAEKHLKGAVMLAKLHEEEGAGTVQPDDIPVEPRCSKEEINKLSDCGERYFRVGTCMKDALEKMIARMENHNRDYVALAKFIKGIVLNIAKVPEILEEIERGCSRLDIQHWEKAWLITEEELKDPVTLEKFEELGKRIQNDLIGVRENLAAILEGRGGDFGLALKHLDAAVKLATLHEEQGAQSITPSDIPIDAECTSAAVSALDGCESRAIRIGTCIKNTVDKVLTELSNNGNIVEKAMFTKGSVLNIAKADVVVKEVIAYCKENDAEKKLKRELLKLLKMAN